MPETPKRIHLLGDGRHEEAVAAATITPGMLLLLNNAGKVIPHNSAGGWAEKAFALEDPLQGRTIANNYATNDITAIVMTNRGDVVYAWLAAGETAVIGSFLSSDGLGALEVATSTQQRLAVALEAVDLSDTSSVATRIRVRVL